MDQRSDLGTQTVTFKCIRPIGYGQVVAFENEPRASARSRKMLVLLFPGQTEEVILGSSQTPSGPFVVLGCRRSEGHEFQYVALPLKHLEERSEAIEDGTIRLLRARSTAAAH
jgi:hypothetical protein